MSTLRQQIIARLGEASMTIRELSRELRLSESEILKHLPHIAKTLSANGRRLGMEPPVCLSCGFRFRKREKLSAPSRCPLCKGEHIAEPRFSIQ